MNLRHVSSCLKYRKKLIDLTLCILLCVPIQIPPFSYWPEVIHHSLHIMYNKIVLTVHSMVFSSNSMHW